MAETIIENIPEPVYKNGIWKGAKIDWSEGYFQFGERLLSQFKNYPDFVGQIDGATGEAETYKNMGERSIRCAIWLQKQGIIQGDVVGLCTKNYFDSCIPLVASFYLGTVINLWRYMNVNEEMVIYYIETTKPKMLFIDEDNAKTVLDTISKKKYFLPVVIFGKRKSQLSFKDILETPNSDEVDKFECTKVQAEDPAVLLYTSGSTDFPKSVLHSYRSIANMMNYYSDDGKPSIVLSFSSLCCVSGMRTFLRSIIFKATMILSNYKRSEVENACKLIEKYKVTRISMTVYAVNFMCITKEVWEYDLSSVEQIAFGGGVIKSNSIEIISRLFPKAEIFIRYGGTEFGTLITGKIKSNKMNSSGKVMFNCEVKIVDLSTRKIVGPNEKGELLCRTPKLMTCYLNNPTATDEVIDSEGWYHTGDLGYYDNEGDFFIVDRITVLLKIRGCHYSPAVIESVIQEHPGVAEVAVVAQASSRNYDLPMAFVTKVPGVELLTSDIHAIVVKKLPSVMRLQGGVCFLEKMPCTSTGKICIKSLRQMARDFAEKTNY
ncbi:luciferin 4-monooxygenase-like [Choristoneura fumiferana]|uniref:luciferin 4-monooxygenase-like n=1 Tax=Choristoneura fumiferana TaxID=7141 RepID=UPI003D15A097